MHITEKSSFFFFQLCIVSTWCDISEMRLDDVLLVQLSVSLSLSVRAQSACSLTQADTGVGIHLFGWVHLES